MSKSEHKPDPEPDEAEDAAADGAYVSPPVQRAVRLLRHIAEGDPVTNVARSARELGISRTTLHRLLTTLEMERFIEPRPEGQGWRIGIGLIGLSAQAFFSQDLVQVSVPVLARLAEQLGLSAHLAVLDGHEVVYLVRRVPNHSFASQIRIGSRLPAHAANMGRIILAYLPPERVERLYAGTVLPAVTRETATTLTQLQAQIAADRALGLAWSDGNYEAGISSVAAAIFDATNTPVAALNITGQSASFEGARRRGQIAMAVRAAADEISQRLGWLAPGRAESEARDRRHGARARRSGSPAMS
jgi:DNA-binding IclR family transcriptional regulator